jgi:hypothetical protein
MARRQLTHWTQQATESQGVWSSSSDRALHVWLRSSPFDTGRTSTRFIDRFLPVITVVLLAISGLTIGWVLFAP